VFLGFWWRPLRPLAGLKEFLAPVHLRRVSDWVTSPNAMRHRSARFSPVLEHQLRVSWVPHRQSPFSPLYRTVAAGWPAPIRRTPTRWLLHVG
jgi:hypothetical protein